MEPWSSKDVYFIRLYDAERIGIGQKRKEEDGGILLGASYWLLGAYFCLCTLVFVYILRTFDNQWLFISYFYLMGKGWALGRRGGKRTGQGPADFRKSRWSVSFILGPLHSLIIYISPSRERKNVAQLCTRKGWVLDSRGGKRTEAWGLADSLQSRWSFSSILGPLQFIDHIYFTIQRTQKCSAVMY